MIIPKTFSILSAFLISPPCAATGRTAKCGVRPRPQRSPSTSACCARAAIGDTCSIVTNRHPTQRTAPPPLRAPLSRVQSRSLNCVLLRRLHMVRPLVATGARGHSRARCAPPWSRSVTSHAPPPHPTLLRLRLELWPRHRFGSRRTIGHRHATPAAAVGAAVRVAVLAVIAVAAHHPWPPSHPAPSEAPRRIRRRAPRFALLAGGVAVWDS